MLDDPRVDQLLEDLLDSGGTPEEACRTHPELLPQVRAGWKRLRDLKTEVNALFHEFPFSSGGTPSPLPTAELPRIRGYEVREILARGGMGIVYKAWHLRLQRPVAVKMLLAGAYAQSHELERFLREAEMVAGLRHANIVQVHEAGDVDGRPYFTMEFVEGGSLAQKLAGTPQPAGQAAALVAGVAEAVHAAHQHGVVHRDLKPGNILLTADGTPKITDFGLARRVEGTAGLTQSGTPVGTPSYMAPEQAEGKSHDVGPAADIYALGAILYELLTGRPPFRAETAAETLRQVIAQDSVPPSRLNAKVPRDLETICLKCLHKEPHHRYASAAALAEDLQRFLRGEAIAARPEGQMGRLVRLVRRRPALSAAVTVSALLLVVLLGGGLWVFTERSANRRASEAVEAETERAAEADVKEMVQSLRKSAWPEARAALERAKGRLGDHGSAKLHQRMHRGQRELELALKLETLSLGPQGGSAEESSPAQAAEFEAAFRDSGLGHVSETPEVVAARIRASDIRNALVLATDQWALYVGPTGPSNKLRQKWLLEVARLADPDPSGWRARAGDLTELKDEATLNELMETAPRPFPSIPILIAIQVRLNSQNKDPVPFLKRIQQAHPDDFWINCLLGRVLVHRNPEEALRYLQAAQSLRPNVIDINVVFGNALQSLNRLDEAVALYRRAEELDPTNYAHHATLAAVLSRLGRYDEAEIQLRRNVALSPKYTYAQKILRMFLVQHGRGEQALVEWKNVLAARPTDRYDYDQYDYYGYAELCLFLGHEDEYRSARQALLSRFGADTDPDVAEQTGRACLLLPAAGDELHQAVALVERAAAADRTKYPPATPNFLFAQALAEYRQGKFERAISLLQGEASPVLGPAPGIVLAMALHRNGKAAEGRKTLAEAVLSHDWRANQVRNQDDWIYHVLRREAERMILPNLPAFLEGKHRPQDNDERLALIGVCQFTNRSLALARLYTDAFASDPNLAEDFRSGRRYNAARAAALVGCGRGEDVAGVGEPERARWRQQARQWLRADLAAWNQALDRDPVGTRGPVRDVSVWRGDRDLSVFFEALELEALPPEERKDCVALSNEVGSLLTRAGVTPSRTGQ